jgi:hypothetical protein
MSSRQRPCISCAGLWTYSKTRQLRLTMRSFQKSLVRGICGLLMRSNGCRKLGSPGRRTPDSADSAFCVRASQLWNHFASLVNATPHARSRKGESRRTLSELFSPFESKPSIIHTCKEYPGAQLRSARCCSSRPTQ